MSQPVRFHTRDLQENGVHIITPVDPSFAELAAKHFEKRTPEALQPLSVFIKNSSKRLVLGYALTWEILDAEGKTITSKTVAYSEPGALMGAEIPKDLIHTTAIEPGAERCFTVNSQIEKEAVGPGGFGGAFSLRTTEESARALQAMIANQKGEEIASTLRAMWADQLSHASDVTVSLDGVIFDDGTFVGPNKTGFFERMQAMLNAKVDLLREITVASEQDKLDETFDSIAAKSRESDVVLGTTASSDDWYYYFRKLYASEISNQRRVHGKENVVRYLIESYRRARPELKKQ